MNFRRRFSVYHKKYPIVAHAWPISQVVINIPLLARALGQKAARPCARDDRVYKIGSKSSIFLEDWDEAEVPTMNKELQNGKGSNQ